jgi:hypothetical protein
MSSTDTGSNDLNGFGTAPDTPSAPAPVRQDNPRSRGHSPAIESRQQAQPGAPRKVTVGGVEHNEQAVADALAERVERQLSRDGLPKDPNGYEIKLPEGFKAPEGLSFEFDLDDPALAQARAMAHAKGWSQEDFSEALGLFASARVAELQRLQVARDAQMQQLGATGPQRIDAIETWLKAKVGDAADIAIASLKAYPVAKNVEMFERLIRAFSSQGGSAFNQSHREQEQPRGEIPGYDNMSFAQRRAAQMNQAYGRGDQR